LQRQKKSQGVHTPEMAYVFLPITRRIDCDAIIISVWFICCLESVHNSADETDPAPLQSLP
jgi:hypothetical protein